MKQNNYPKVMTAKEAVQKFVKDQETLIIGNYTEAPPLALIFEVIRQKKKELTLFSQSGNIDAELLIAGDCVKRVFSAYAARWGGRAGGSMLDRYHSAGKLEVEDYSNFTYNAMLAAGAAGYSFMPVLPAIMDTDVFWKQGVEGRQKFGVVACPFSGREIPVVPAANPDICLVHVQRADRLGNAQHWGALGSTVHACLASKKIIVSCEEIVDHEVIRSSPHHTIIPDFRVDAVVEEPWGAHPMELPGFYSADTAMIGLMTMANATDTGLKEWMEQWLYNLPDRAAYLKHYEKIYGSDQLASIKAQPYYSAPTNYGIGTRSFWSDDGKYTPFDADFDTLEKLIAEKGDIVHE